MAWRVGVDSGGTFTDVCLFDEDTGRVEVWKVASTPDDPSRGIADGVAEGVARVRMRTPADIGYFGHGTTVGDQCADPASRREDRADHHRRVSRPAGDRPAEAPRSVRPAGRQAAGAGVARSAPGSAGAGAPRRHGGNAARRSRVPRRGARAARRPASQAVAVCFLYGFVGTAARGDARAASSPRNSPRPSPASRHEVAPEFREFERMSHRGGERLSRPGDAALHQPAGRTAGRAGHDRDAASDAVEWRRDRLRAGGAAAGAHRAVRAVHRRGRRAGGRRGWPASPT